MRSELARRTLVVLLVVALGLVAACSGDDDDDGATPAESGALTTATPTRTPAPTSTPAVTPTVAETETATPAATATASAAAIDSPYERYHYVLAIMLDIEGSSRGDVGPLLAGTVEGDYVAPDAHAFVNAFELGGFGFEAAAIVIGEQAWSRDSATAPWAPTTIDALWEDGSADLTSMDPELFLYDREFGTRLEALPGTPEQRLGRETVRYAVTPELFDALAATLPPELLLGFDPEQVEEFSMAVSVDPATGAVVAVEIAFLGASGAFPDVAEFGVPADAQLALSVTFEVTRINDPGITIEPPAE
jgi:hypothetical protein